MQRSQRTTQTARHSSRPKYTQLKRLCTNMLSRVSLKWYVSIVHAHFALYVLLKLICRVAAAGTYHTTLDTQNTLTCRPLTSINVHVMTLYTWRSPLHTAGPLGVSTRCLSQNITIQYIELTGIPGLHFKSYITHGGEFNALVVRQSSARP